MSRAQGKGHASKNRADSIAIEWGDHSRITPGEYRAYCKWGKWYFDPGFKRWTCLLRWEVLSHNLTPLAIVPQWFALGRGEKPRASRRGKYFPEWIRANGGPPSRRDRLSPAVFVHRMARVEVGDTEGPAPYSVIRRIIDGSRVFLVTQSARHTIKKSHSLAEWNQGLSKVVCRVLPKREGGMG